MVTHTIFTARFFSEPKGSHTFSYELVPQNTTGSKTNLILCELAIAFFETYNEGVQATLLFENNLVTLQNTKDDRFKTIFNKNAEEYFLRIAEAQEDYLPVTVKLIVLPES